MKTTEAPPVLSPDDADVLAGLFALLADRTRCRVLYTLDTVGELCVNEISGVLGVSEDNAGYALRLLRTAGLVKARKEGRSVYYRLADRFPQPLRGHCLPALVQLTRNAPQF